MDIIGILSCVKDSFSEGFIFLNTLSVLELLQFHEVSFSLIIQPLRPGTILVGFINPFPFSGSISLKSCVDESTFSYLDENLARILSELIIFQGNVSDFIDGWFVQYPTTPPIMMALHSSGRSSVTVLVYNDALFSFHGCINASD